MVRAQIHRVASSLCAGHGDDESCVLTVSHGVAAGLALVWLALVFFGPRPIARTNPAVTFTVVPPVVEVLPTPPRELTRRSSASPVQSGARRGSPGILDAFASASAPSERGDVVRGVRITSSVPTSDPIVRAVPLGTPSGVETPGRSRTPSGGLSSAGLGVVSRESVARASVAIMPPDVRPVNGSGARGDATAVGQSARAYAPQLQRCYLDEGLTRNADLAGLVRLAIEVEGGRVVSARVLDRTWSGVGVTETESCLLRAVRGWRLGTSSATVTLPFSFTSAR